MQSRGYSLKGTGCDNVDWVRAAQTGGSDGLLPTRSLPQEAGNFLYSSGKISLERTSVLNGVSIYTVEWYDYYKHSLDFRGWISMYHLQGEKYVGTEDGNCNDCRNVG
jgi:hypothetical protein